MHQKSDAGLYFSLQLVPVPYGLELYYSCAGTNFTVRRGTIACRLVHRSLTTSFQTDVCVPFQPSVDSSALYKDATQVRRPPVDRLKQFRALLGGAKQGETQITGEVSNVSA